MLRARLVNSVKSEGIGTILHNPEAQKLLVSKENGDIEVYSREGKKLKLFQTYPQFLQSAHTEETKISGLYTSTELSTVFARCDKSLLLFNNTNLQKYDQIVDKRGIDDCWLFELPLPDCEDKMTYLIYSTKVTSKLRMLIWEGRIYKKIVEASLGSDREIVHSVETGDTGIILATNLGIYHWSYGESVLSRIDKIVKRKHPKDTVRALDELESICKNKDGKSDFTVKDTQSFMSTSGLTKKSSIMNFWKKDRSNRGEPLNKVRYVFSPSSGKHMMFDGITKNLFTFGIASNKLPYMEASNHNQFIEWNCNFSRMQFLSSNILILSNKKSVRFVDYENGFTFLHQEILEGIRKIEVIGNCYFIVWTIDNQLQLFQYQVDDGSDDKFDDDESICGDIYESDFYQLWRKVLFYDFFLNSPDALQLCESNDREESLNLCALKLRDLTVLWSLGIFERFDTYMSRIRKQNFIDADCGKLQNIIIESVFGKLIQFWAPPQLVILKTFPLEISDLVLEMTEQKHNCVTSNEEFERRYDLPEELIRKWLLPYLIDVRRNLRNMSRNETVTWEISGRSIEVQVDFFLLDKHGSLDIHGLLTLIDTVLFKTYLYYFPSMVSPLLCVENFCDYNIVVNELRSRHKFQELVYFYFQRGRHEEALVFLTKLCARVKENKDSAEIQDGIKVLILDYLKRLPSQYLDLVFEYTEWLLTEFGTSKEILEEIFLNDNPLCAKRDQLKVYQFINRFDKVISLQYLEFIISNFNCQSAQAHTILIKRYFEDLEERATRIKLKSVLETTSVYEPRTILRILNEIKDDNSQRSSDQSKFIENMKIYPLQRLGRYEEAVDILFDDLRDYDATSSFCEKIYNGNRKAGEPIMLYFFKKLISSTEGSKNPRIAFFLQEHSSKLDTVEIYKLLPNSALLYDLKDVLLQTLKSHSIKKDETRIKKSLLQVELINTSYELNKGLSRFVIIDENYKCPICKKLFSTHTADTALWFTLNNKDFVVHYTCGRAFEAKMQAKKTKDKLRADRTVSELKSSESNKIRSIFD